MTPRPAIFSTLFEAAQLFGRHFGFILILAICASIPAGIMNAMIMPQIYASKERSHQLHEKLRTNHVGEMSSSELNDFSKDAGESANSALVTMALTLAVAIVQLITGALITATILGVLKKPPPATPLWPNIRSNIARFFWPLIVLSLLLAIIAIIITIPVEILIVVVLQLSVGADLHGPAQVDHSQFFSYALSGLTMLAALLYLIFVKYALAGPVVLIEKIRPLAALRRSWDLTRGFFWYVLGSYIFVAAAEYGFDELFQRFVPEYSFTVATAVELVFKYLLQAYWIVLAWCMYWRVRDAEYAF